MINPDPQILKVGAGRNVGGMAMSPLTSLRLKIIRGVKWTQCSKKQQRLFPILASVTVFAYFLTNINLYNNHNEKNKSFACKKHGLQQQYGKHGLT